MISFRYVDSVAKIFLILYPPFQNSTTRYWICFCNVLLTFLELSKYVLLIIAQLYDELIRYLYVQKKILILRFLFILMCNKSK